MISVNMKANRVATTENDPKAAEAYLERMKHKKGLKQKDAQLEPGVYTIKFSKVTMDASVKNGKELSWLTVKGYLDNGQPVTVRNLWIHTEACATMSFGALFEQGMPMVYNEDKDYDDYVNEMNAYKGTLKLGVYIDHEYNDSKVYTLDLGKIAAIERAMTEPVQPEEVDLDF